MPASLYRYAKMISLIFGFLFAAMGAIWSLLVVDRLIGELEQLSDTKAKLIRQMDSFNAIASEYFIANQQGDLIFVLAQTEGARQNIAGLIYEGNLLDRATPVRNMIGALALANMLDYRQTYDAYERMNVETRSNPSLENLTGLKLAEKEIISKGLDQVPVILAELSEIERSINVNESAQKRARVIGVISSILGSFLLLCANLIAERDRWKSAAAPSEAGERPADEANTR